MAASKIIAYLEANAAKFVTEMEKSRKSIQGVAGDIKLIKFDAIVNLGERAFHTAEQIYHLAYSTASFGSELQRNARTLGMTIEEYQRWMYVAKAADVDQEQLMLGIRVLTKNMGDLRTGTGEAKDSLARIGITAKDSNKSIGELLPQIITKLSQIGSVAEQNQLSMDIFGSRSGLAIANMVREGKNIDEIIKRFDDLGLAISDDMVEKLAKSEQAFKDMGFMFTKFKAEILGPLVVEFSKLLGFIIDLKRETEKGIEIQIKYTPIISKEEQKVGSEYLMLAGFGTEEAIEKDLQKAIENVQPRMQNRWKEWVEEYKPIKKEELIPTITTEERPHGKEWVTEIVPTPYGWYTMEEIQKGIEDTMAAAGEFGEMANLQRELSEQSTKMKEIQAGITDEVKETAKAYGITAEELLRIREGLNAGIKDNAHFIDSLKEVNPILDNIGKSFGDTLVSNMTQLMSATDSWGNKFKSVGTSILQTLSQIIIKQMLMSTLFSNAKEGTGFLGSGSGIGQLISGIGGLIKGSAQTGMDYVPQTGLYILHQDEAVIPAEENRKGKGGDTYITYVEATDVNSFERRYGGVIDSRVFQGKRFNRMLQR